jgi:hypothetical protein
MPLTGNVIDVQKIQLTDTFQTWFAKTNEMVDALNPVNIYDIDDGAGTNVTYGLTGTAYNGVKYVNVNAGYGVAVGSSGSGKPWSNLVSLDFSGISGDAYTLTGNPDYTLTGGSPRTSEVNIYDLFLVQDISDNAQGASGTTKRVQARYMLPREVYQPTLDFYGDLNVKGRFTSVAANSTQLGSLSINSQYVYLSTTGSAGSTAGAWATDAQLSRGGVVIAMTGGIPNKEFVWDYNGASNKSYWTFNTPFGAKEPNLPLVASKFISRNFIGGGSTANTFIFEADSGQSNKFWLTESGSNPYFGIVKDTSSSNVNFNVYNGVGITSVAYIIAGTTSQYTGVTANAFIQYANVDLHDGAHATTGASAWTIPVGDQFGQLYADRHNAGQIKRRFVQTNHGLTTGQAVAINITGATVTGAQANSISTEAFGIVDRVISANEFSVTMKGYMDLSANGLVGIGVPVTGQVYYLDWAVKGGLTTNNNTPQSYLYQPVFQALNANSGIVLGTEANIIFPLANDQVYMRGMIPIGSIQPYAGGLAGLTMGLAGGSILVSDVQYNGNWQPCDGRALSATGASGFVDLFNLIGYTYPMRGTIQSSDGAANAVFQPDRGTVNLGSLGLGSLAGIVRVIKRTGDDSRNTIKDYPYTGLTADGTTITFIGLTSNNAFIGPTTTIVDILSPKVGNYFFAPDLRGKAPFGEYAPYGARGEGFSLTAGTTGGTATGDGGLFTNYIIRSRREADALILTGHNHDTRYLRKDLTDSIALAGSTLTLQNLNVLGQIGTNIGIGLLPIADNGSSKVAYPLSVLKNGDFETWVSVYNQTDSASSLAGFRMNNNVANATLALNRATSSTLTLSTDSSCSGGIQISTGGVTGTIRFYTNGTERMRIGATGNISISSNMSISSGNMSISSNVGIKGISQPSSPISVVSESGSGGIRVWRSAGGGSGDSLNPCMSIDVDTTRGVFSTWGDGFRFTTGATGSVLGSVTNRMIIKSDTGNIGIGTDTPSVKLDVAGDVKVSASLTANNISASNNLQIGPATLTKPDGSMPLFGIRAWAVVNHSTSNTSTVLRSGNLNSPAWNTSGSNTDKTMRFNFVTAMPDANYCVIINGQRKSTDLNGNGLVATVKTKGTTGFNVLLQSTNSDVLGSVDGDDLDQVYVAVLY